MSIDQSPSFFSVMGQTRAMGHMLATVDIDKRTSG